MKKIFIVEANPKREQSKKGFFVHTYIEEAKKAGHEVRFVNLYDLNIDYLRFNGETPDMSLSEELKQAQENIVWADQLVFVYPIWWYAMPGIMKSFIDKTFNVGVVANMGKYGPEPLLKGKTAVIMQSYDMPSIGMKLLGDLPYKYMKVILTNWCGVKIEKRFDFAIIGASSEKTRQRWLRQIKRFVSKI